MSEKKTIADRMRDHANAARESGLFSEDVWRDLRHAADELHRLYAIPEPDVKTMVDRFLGWRLPATFGPDCGITFKPVNHPNSWPVGTNLFTADEARQMFAHVLGVENAEGQEK